MTAIEVRDVFRVHSTPEGDAAALQGLTLAVAEREVAVVLGPSGSGKTTLLRILAGLDRPSAGSVRVLDRDLAKLSRRALASYRAATIGYADQHYAQALAPELAARELVALPLALRARPRAEQRRRADELLERVGLADKRSARPPELSGGEQQRVAVCAALAHRPRLLLADEPTGELDAATAQRVYALIAELARAERCTTVIVSHDRASTAVADRVIEIRDGRLASESSADTDGARAIVVGRGGWLRLPEEYLARVRIGSRAAASVDEGRLVLTPLEEATTDAPVEPPRPAVTGDGRVPGAVVAEVRALVKRYGAGATERVVFEHVDAAFETGKLYVVTGPSGSGKTTFLHLLAGLEPPSGGEIFVGSRPIAALGRAERARLRAAEIGVVGQQAGLIPFLSTTENVELALALRGLTGDEAATRALEALRAVGLEERAGQRVSRLSTGERARVALARAVAAGPSLLLVDEPTSRVDEANALAIAALLRRLAAETATAIVAATHDERVVEQADEELRLAAGGEIA